MTHNVFVLGSINLDCVVNCEYHPKPGETIIGKSLSYFPGGKGANQAVAAARLGANVIMFGAVGNDDNGRFMLSFLSDNQVNVDTIERKETATGFASITVDSSGENSIIVIPGANSEVSASLIQDNDIETDGILVLQNEISTQINLAALQDAKVKKRMTIYNPAPAIKVANCTFPLCDIIIVNETEYDFYKSQLQTYDGILIKTLGKQGVVIVQDNQETKIEGHKVKAVDTTGAGDCFVGAFAAALAQGETILTATKFANKAASIAVQRRGAGVGMPHRKDIT